MSDVEFSRLVTLACHDLRTPLATVNGFAKTLVRSGRLASDDERFVALIESAAEQMNDLLDLLGLAARIEAGGYEPARREVDTLHLVRGEDERIEASGSGETILTDEPAVRRALAAVATAALRHGGLERITWTVTGRELALAPLPADAAPVVAGEEPKDLGALVARITIEQLGGSVRIAGERLRITL
jgi:signal transduction histidine kinase